MMQQNTKSRVFKQNLYKCLQLSCKTATLQQLWKLNVLMPANITILKYITAKWDKKQLTLYVTGTSQHSPKLKSFVCPHRA